MNFDLTMRSIQRAVVDAGGEWLGIQQSFPGDPSAMPQIIFRHPGTKKVISVSFNPVTLSEDDLFDDIRKALETAFSISKDEYIPVKVAKLQKISRNLGEIQAEVDALLERKKK